jgi:tRNA-uridine 2-sulfurtransferase
MTRAVALMSTGLDSLLAARLVADQGIEVHGLHCSFRFAFSSGRERPDVLASLVEPMGVRLHVVDITDPFMDVMRRPEHGFGSAVNPCIDCHLFMIRRAKILMEELGAGFLVTGEVVGQRPMSQNKPTLFHIEKLAGLKRLILRPLSAKVLPVTIPEENGWVDRERLFGISGRGRKPQETLAAELGITEYFQPAGGCILTDPFYAGRLRAFIRNRGQESITTDVMMLCRFGRHFWTGMGRWVIIGREEKDNEGLERLSAGRWIFETEEITGPTALADAVSGPDEAASIASMLVRYVNRRKGDLVRVLARRGGESYRIEAAPADPAEMDRWMVRGD